MFNLKPVLLFNSLEELANKDSIMKEIKNYCLFHGINYADTHDHKFFEVTFDSCKLRDRVMDHLRDVLGLSIQETKT